MLKLFNFFCKEVKKKKNIRKELKLWKLKESLVKKCLLKKLTKDVMVMKIDMVCKISC